MKASSPPLYFLGLYRISSSKEQQTNGSLRRSSSWIRITILDSNLRPRMVGPDQWFHGMNCCWSTHPSNSGIPMQFDHHPTTSRTNGICKGSQYSAEPEFLDWIACWSSYNKDQLEFWQMNRNGIIYSFSEMRCMISSYILPQALLHWIDDWSDVCRQFWG